MQPRAKYVVNPLRPSIDAQYQPFQARSLHSQLAVLRPQLSEATAQKEQYLSDLILAQSRVDRLNSKTVRAMAPSPTANGDVVQHNESDTDVKSEKPSSPSVSRHG